MNFFWKAGAFKFSLSHKLLSWPRNSWKLVFHLHSSGGHSFQEYMTLISPRVLETC